MLPKHSYRLKTFEKLLQGKLSVSWEEFLEKERKEVWGDDAPSFKPVHTQIIPINVERVYGRGRSKDPRKGRKTLSVDELQYIDASKWEHVRPAFFRKAGNVKVIPLETNEALADPRKYDNSKYFGLTDLIAIDVESFGKDSATVEYARSESSIEDIEETDEILRSNALAIESWSVGSVSPSTHSSSPDKSVEIIDNTNEVTVLSSKDFLGIQESGSYTERVRNSTAIKEVEEYFQESNLERLHGDTTPLHSTAESNMFECQKSLRGNSPYSYMNSRNSNSSNEQISVKQTYLWFPNSESDDGLDDDDERISLESNRQEGPREHVLLSGTECVSNNRNNVQLDTFDKHVCVDDESRESLFPGVNALSLMKSRVDSNSFQSLASLRCGTKRRHDSCSPTEVETRTTKFNASTPTPRTSAQMLDDRQTEMSSTSNDRAPDDELQRESPTNESEELKRNIAEILLFIKECQGDDMASDVTTLIGEISDESE